MEKCMLSTLYTLDTIVIDIFARNLKVETLSYTIPKKN